MLRKTDVIILLLFIITCTACFKKYDAGIRTTITGKVFDSNPGVPLSGVALWINEYKAGIPFGRFLSSFDTVRTGVGNLETFSREFRIDTKTFQK